MRVVRRSVRALLAAVVAVAALLPGAPAPTVVAAPAGAPATVPANAPANAPGTHWSWPVTDPVRILRGFEAPLTRYSAGHRGIDLGAEPGVPVSSPAAGTVFFAGWVVDRPVLSIRHEDGLMSSFEPVDAVVVAGARVARGQVIGSIGTGPHCGNACLHFGVRLHGNYVSPLLLYGGVPRAVLLPVP